MKKLLLFPCLLLALGLSSCESSDDEVMSIEPGQPQKTCGYDRVGDRLFQMGCRHKSGRLCLCFGQLHRIHDRRRSDHNPETDPTLARFAYVSHLCRRQSGTHDRLGRTHRRFRHRPDASDPGPVMHQRRIRRRGRRHMASRQRRHRLCLQIQRRDAMDRSRSRRIENHQERIRSGSEKHLYHIRQGPTARFGGFGGALRFRSA